MDIKYTLKSIDYGNGKYQLEQKIYETRNTV